MSASQALPAGEAPVLRLADHPALDFLNSEATPGTTPLDWLSDGEALLSWMVAVSLLDAGESEVIRDRMPPAELNRVAAEIRALRRWFRKFVEDHRGATWPSGALNLAPLTQALAVDDAYSDLLHLGGEPPRLVRRRRWIHPDPLLAIIAEAIAELMVQEDWRLVRACEGQGCTNLFLDRTKAHARRWCSMTICGNRAKVAAYRARTRSKARLGARRTDLPALPNR